ncbi:WD40 repeat domain-containing protein [Phenylobacterium sp.]|jgi:WD40 repeat protein|uniref:WD40 repeat domain-containing protein n=1 Tax=Phenylobacterium sp. TaxID=1871053 RepID=UPI002E331E73|nr:WD40 repeat domain-containing protein [Phenylobacterium sp.]HEX4712700.1 WD40 repeat domain-containing protein [Phenylobacterium sp.]
MSDASHSTFDAYVTAVSFDAAGRAVFALGDGTVRFEGGASVQAHQGAILSAAPHPSGAGLVTGGDDGRVVWSHGSESEEIASLPGRWIDALAASSASGLIAFAAGRDVHVRDVADAAFGRTFAHERSVADLAFEPRGRRLAAATYGGAWLWYARIEGQKPARLAWAGSHVAIAWSPEGKFLVSAMQENQLHGWRVADEKNMRMGGYPSKPRSLAFLSKGALLATSGANGVVVWPFAGAAGPMGKQAAEVGYDEAALVVRVAGAPALPWVAAGLDDGRVWACDLTGQRIVPIKAEKGAPVTALAITPDAKTVAWGCEDGEAGVAKVS